MNTHQARELLKLQTDIQTSTKLTRRMFRYMEAQQLAHSDYPSSPEFAALCGVSERTWRRWLAGSVPIPVSALRLVYMAVGLDTVAYRPHD